MSRVRQFHNQRGRRAIAILSGARQTPATNRFRPSALYSDFIDTFRCEVQEDIQLARPRRIASATLAKPRLSFAGTRSRLFLWLGVARTSAAEDILLARPSGTVFTDRGVFFADPPRLARPVRFEPAPRRMRWSACRRACACSFPNLSFRGPIDGNIVCSR